jgi:hypothetical protein
MFDEIFNSTSISSFYKIIGDRKNLYVLIWNPFETLHNIFSDINQTNVYEMVNFLNSNNIHIFNIGSCDFKDSNVDLINLTNFKNLNWPTSLLHYSKFAFEKSYNKPISDINIDTDFEKLFYCFNNKPRLNRRMIVDFLKKYDLFNDGIITWNITSEICPEDFNFNYWKEEKLVYDVTEENRFLKDESIVYCTKELLNMKSLFNLVGETFFSVNHSDFFITEKTFKNYLIKQPFVSFSKTGFNNELKNYGFKLYDEVLDYSFDNINSTIISYYDHFFNDFKKYSKSDLISLYSKISEKVEYNKNKALEICNNDPYIPSELVELYKSYSDEFNNDPYINYHINIKEIMKNK